MSNTREERHLRNQQEHLVGKLTVMKNMSIGLVEHLMLEMDPAGKFDFYFNHNTIDFRDWTVTVTVKTGETKYGRKNIHTELFADFPSDTLKAKMMLVRGF